LKIVWKKKRVEKCATFWETYGGEKEKFPVKGELTRGHCMECDASVSVHVSSLPLPTMRTQIKTLFIF